MKLTDEQVKEIIKIKDENITKTLFLELFGRDAKTLKVKYNPNDWFLLVPGMISVYKDKIPLKTTIGRFIFNRFLNEGIFGTKFPYFNGSKYDKFDEQVTDAYIEGEITPDQLCTYQTKRAWLEYTPVEILVPGISFSSITPHPAVIKRREELFKKYEKELSAGDVKVASAIEAELIDLAKEVNKGDPSMRLYDLKKPSLGNNFKNIAVMVGPLPSNSEPGKYYIAKQSYIEGIPKENYDNYADQLIFGSWSRSVNTQVGGAQVKEMQAAMQSEIIDLNPNSDCGTKLYATIELNENNIDMYYWKYAITPKGLVMITKKNASQFIGKAVKIRSALYCKNENYCEKCTGAFYNRMKISNAGLTCFLIGSKIQNLSMKAMHTSTITTKELEWQKYFSDYRQ